MAGNFAEFGPEESGTRLAELDYQKDVSETLQNLGRIAQTQETQARIPGLQAEARKTGAEADALELKAQTQKKMAALMSGQATVDKVGNPGYDLANLAFKSGDFDTGMNMLAKTSQIEARTATTAAQQAAEKINNLKLVNMHAQQVGAMASAAVDQASYDQMRMAAEAQGYDLSGLPADYPSARPMLNQLTAQGMTVKQHIDAQIAQTRADSQEKTDAALIRSRNAAAASREAQRKVLQQKYDFAAKNGGEQSETALNYKRALTELAKTRNAGLEMKQPTPIPTNPAQREAGKIYLWSDGKTKVVWDKNPATGKMQAREITPAEATKMQKLGSWAAGLFSPKDDAEEEEDDDDGDE